MIEGIVPEGFQLWEDTDGTLHIMQRGQPTCWHPRRERAGSPSFKHDADLLEWHGMGADISESLCIDTSHCAAVREQGTLLAATDHYGITYYNDPEHPHNRTYVDLPERAMHVFASAAEETI